MRISDWSSDVCSSDLLPGGVDQGEARLAGGQGPRDRAAIMRPLEGLLVLDFSTLLPGPMASLMLAEAGARVVKIERPGRGDEMRSYEPQLGEDSVNFVLLNRGKQSIAIDLKDRNNVV